MRPKDIVAEIRREWRDESLQFTVDSSQSGAETSSRLEPPGVEKPKEASLKTLGEKWLQYPPPVFL